MPAINADSLALKGFFDAITDFFTGFINEAILPAVNNQLTGLSLLGAHVLGGLSQENDIIGTLGTLFGKRGIFDDLIDSLTQSVTTVANQLLGEAALQLAIALAGFSQTGGLFGREVDSKAIFDALTDSFMQIFNQVLLPALNTQLMNVSLLGAHLLGGLSQENDVISALGSLFGREIDSKGFFDSLTDAFMDIFNQVLLPAVNTQLTNVALLGAHLLGGISQENDVIGALGSLFGKRGIFDELLDSLTQSVTSAANTLLSQASLQLAIALATFSQSGGLLGRSLENKDFWTDLGNTLLGQVIDVGNSLLSTLSLQAAIALAGFGLGGGIPSIGK